ncbi:acyltransferase [Granulicella cerasi]|uniref:Acyltransferase n=1 Tax=Granulicella cerasi TaxID=741063 RepID=A0ABW1ZAA7_9BACT|nr:acyltransferase [Granulicella cerasi]
MPSPKQLIAAPLTAFLRAFDGARESLRRIVSFSSLAAQLRDQLPASTVVLGRQWVYGTRNIRFGEHTLLYPGCHFETQEHAALTLGNGCVLSRGVHLVAMAGITIGDGTMIGEYSSLRDANHAREEGVAMRDAGHTAKPITIGREVWIGRGVTILGGITIGDHATVGANAVVTRDVPAGAVVAGVPAKPIISREEKA